MKLKRCVQLTQRKPGGKKHKEKKIINKYIEKKNEG